MKLFVNEVALDTGGTSGIGLATVQRLCLEGANVITCARTEAKHTDLPSHMNFMRCDVSNKENVDFMFEVRKRNQHSKLVVFL
jgi:NAD(P)-dependent dehydrogenase (short-subunit alcohol dehydrogenase family)